MEGESELVTGLNTKKEDGRRTRSKKSRLAIASAMLELVTEGVPNPTAKIIAERAGVSLRLVFHHFKDMESIFKETDKLQLERLKPFISQNISGEGPLDTRLEAFIKHRTTLLEFITPTRKSALHFEILHESVHRSLQAFRKSKRDQVVAVFAQELDIFKGKEKKERTLALQAAVSWTTWQTLREHQQLTKDMARRVMRRMIHVILTR